MILNTIEKAEQFIRKFKVIGFNFASDNVIYYKSLIPVSKDGYLVEYIFSFFIEECDTFHYMDSMDDFLGDLQIYEIIESCKELDSKKMLYSRSYKSNFISREVEEETLEDLEERLEKLILNENFEEASKVRDLIKNKKK
tara:strand:- start:317 stop:736 length:420 start_codon:yes stop_codon:yes gene_type:complete